VSKVSILVFLDGALKVSYKEIPIILIIVSILVFLDGALKGIDKGPLGRLFSVSILVFLDGALKASPPLSPFESDGFQSLFFWMAL